MGKRLVRRVLLRLELDEGQPGQGLAGDRGPRGRHAAACCPGRSRPGRPTAATRPAEIVLTSLMDAIREAIRDIAARIVAGQLAPVEGAQQIAERAAQLSDPGELGVFAELARTGDEAVILERAPLLVADTA